MIPIGTKKIQLGDAGAWSGEWSHIIEGSLEVDIYVCSQCKKIEFYATSKISGHERLSQKKCPECGNEHDFDYPKCPSCNHRY